MALQRTPIGRRETFVGVDKDGARVAMLKPTP